MPLSLKIAVLLLLGLIIFLIGLVLPEDRVGETNVMRLLIGDSSVRISHLKIEGQQRRIVCEDPRMLDEIANAFRHAEEKPLAGATYLLTLLFKDGGEFVTRMYVQKGGISVCIFPKPRISPADSSAGFRPDAERRCLRDALFPSPALSGGCEYQPPISRQ